MELMKKFLTRSAKETKKLGEVLSSKILSPFPIKKKAFVVALSGDLGGGKTTFLQGFAKGLGTKQKILSPTFLIMKRFRIPREKNWFYHIDCYRIKKPKEILDLGFKEIISNPKNIVAIEWADRIQKIIPKDAIWIKFEFVDKNIRKLLYFNKTKTC